MPKKKPLKKVAVRKIPKKEFITMLEPDIDREEQMQKIFNRIAVAIEAQVSLQKEMIKKIERYERIYLKIAERQLGDDIVEILKGE